MTTDELRKKVFSYVEQAIAEGFIMKRYESNGTEEGACCVLQAVRFCTPENEHLRCYHRVSQRLLGIDQSQSYSLEAGFEGWPPPPRANPDAYAIGQEVAKKYLGC